MPANTILLPGTAWAGLCRYLASRSNVHSPACPFMASEYRASKPVAEAVLRPTIPHRFGPTRFLSPLLGVWQARHFLKMSAPASALALGSSPSTDATSKAAAGVASFGLATVTGSAQP